MCSPRLWLHIQAHVHPLQGTASKQPAQIFKRPHGFQVVRTQRCLRDQFTATQARALRHGTSHRAGQDRLGLLHPVPVDDGIQQHGQQQIRNGACGHDGSAGPQRLGVEGQMPLFGGHRRFPLVQHAHVSTQRKRPQDKLRGRALGLPAQQQVAKAHREAQHLHSARHGHPVVAVFVYGNQKAEGHDEGNDGEEHVRVRVAVETQAARRSAACSAALRAWLSRSSNASSELGLEGETASKVARFTA
ncbi:hypothetical protein D3C71_923810 [compost metagenome]